MIIYINFQRFRSVVVITSALHAEGREFEPHQNLEYFLPLRELVLYLKDP